MAKGDGGGRGRSSFEEISELDSKMLFKPSVPSLIVSNSEANGPNVMSASWWMVAGYDPFRYLLSVNRDTYTHQIIEENPEFVMAAPTTELIDALTLCGTVSGRDLDKVEHLGLDLVPASGVDVPLLESALGNVECEVTNSFENNECTYYFARVVAAHAKRDVRGGRLLSPTARPLAYLGSDWVADDDSTKHRYYVEFDEDDVRSFPGDELIPALPESVRDEYVG